MSDLSISQVLSSRYRTSAEADRYTNALMNGLGLSTRAAVARLALGRSLALGALPEEGVDAKGLEIPAQILFSTQDIMVWVGLIVTHAVRHADKPLNSSDAFRAAVRSHWHRGASLLMEDWLAANEDYDRFVETLINRRASLPEIAERGGAVPSVKQPTESTDISGELLKALSDIGITGEARGYTHGPRVTRYKILLPDINQFDKLRRGLERLGLVLGLNGALPSVSPGDEAKTVFIDVPRPVDTWKNTGFSDLKAWCADAPDDPNRLTVFPGVDVMGKPFSFDLASAPHVLVGGATGMGKSVCVHALILSLLLKHSPSTLQLALIDPKQVEFAVYADSEFLYGGAVVSDAAKARDQIRALVQEMESRYAQFAKAGASSIAEARAKGIRLPFIVVFIEELADLIVQNRDVETHIVRLAQKARAAGIHLVLATQRPDAKTFSGLIRSNIPARIALTVQKASESSIILDETGAESLLGRGDMLIKTTGSSPVRVHGVYIARTDAQEQVRRQRAPMRA
ncbi:FtsK/SpoIIIE domain-containing protein [Caballeronia mineralivorans]|nr:FtsK/SpoIIIE domain-containing protein [Caballeronia mineralivorans]